MNNFAERLSYAINDANITQAELSRRTGIGRNSISDYLKGKYEAKQDNVYLIANALGINEAWLIGMEAPMKKDSILHIFDQLDVDRQKMVISYAKNQLNEQIKSSGIYTLAAHSDDPQRIVTDDDVDHINSVLDEIDRKYDKK